MAAPSADGFHRQIGIAGQLPAWFGDRARERDYRIETVRQTWDVIAAFGSYGFCKANACAFAVLTHQSAWLEAHRLAAFCAGQLTHDPGMYPSAPSSRTPAAATSRSCPST